jgi:hypothetical protein
MLRISKKSAPNKNDSSTYFRISSPWMSEQEFQDYWRYVHAINYAMPIPQVRKYKIDCRMDVANLYHPLAYAGVAEIWLNNEQEKAESVLTPEYLEGAKKDEKNGRRPGKR